MADEFENVGGDDALPGTGPDTSTDSASLSDLTSELRSTINEAPDAPVADVHMDPAQAPFGQQQQQPYPNNAPSGSEGQVDAGAGVDSPPASPAGRASVREILQSYGMPVHHYPDDQTALNDLLTQSFQAQQQAAEAARRLEAMQDWARQIQQQQSQAPPAAPAPQQPSRPQWRPEYADISVIDGEKGEKRYVSKSTGLPVAPETVQQAMQWSQSREEFLRNLYERPEEAMKPIVSEAVQQAMSQFQQYQAQQQRQQEYQANLNQANDYVMQSFGQMLFQQGPYGLNLNQPTPLGYRYLQHLDSMPQSLTPMERARFASNQLAVEILSSNPTLFTNGAPSVNGQHQFIPQPQAPQQTPGDRQRQALRRTAHRNPSVSSPSAASPAEDFFADPSVDIREKLARAMVGVN